MTADAGAARRDAIFASLAWRNRIVGLLRLAVPLFGALALLGLVGQIVVSSMLQAYGVAGIRIDRGTLLVETPQYHGASADGSRYLIRAAQARSAFGQTHIIVLSNATFDYIAQDHPPFHATGASATVDSQKQTVDIPGQTIFHGDDGMRGTLTDTLVNNGTGDMVSHGAVDINFADGSHLVAADMVRVAEAQTWTFTKATMVVPDLPKSSFPPIPFVTSLWVVR